eukprot:CAMPEP_0194294986 /NCGR_PEP_ID=MMETSP0169-20130528/52312_1 /TAXON_ID=218684 /ORGANISM="Corethron pennatum, Strain L29A3" /LENGTH=395 /DNA_ID=CAMNT_0039044053 /DNA_START=69 /DNA_END=1256 /DNA_ORIENTATION=+
MSSNSGTSDKGLDPNSIQIDRLAINSPPLESIDEPAILKELRRHLSPGAGAPPPSDGPTVNVDDTPALPVAAIKCMLHVINHTSSHTMMGLQAELSVAADTLVEFAASSPSDPILGGRSHIALRSGCDLFLRYVTRAFLELPDFDAVVAAIAERGERFARLSVTARDRIARLGAPFVHHGAQVMTHGYSRTVRALFSEAARCGARFEVVVPEGRPDGGGAKAAAAYSEVGVPVRVVLDSAVACAMENVDAVVVGAEGVVENGGVVNKIGTYNMAIAAHAMGVPFYVAAESYKFARMYPLNNGDLVKEMDMDPARMPLDFVDTTKISWNKLHPKEVSETEKSVTLPAEAVINLPDSVTVENHPCDYTPAKYITLLFTDLGVLTPSAVSDELIRLYH